jgi:hypothetical protein
VVFDVTQLDDIVLFTFDSVVIYRAQIQSHFYYLITPVIMFVRGEFVYLVNYCTPSKALLYRWVKCHKIGRAHV